MIGGSRRQEAVEGSRRQSGVRKSEIRRRGFEKVGPDGWGLREAGSDGGGKRGTGGGVKRGAVEGPKVGEREGKGESKKSEIRRRVK